MNECKRRLNQTAFHKRPSIIDFKTGCKSSLSVLESEAIAKADADADNEIAPVTCH
jgi:hypothetical protein